MKTRTHTPNEKALARALNCFLADFNDYDGPTPRLARAALRGAGFDAQTPSPSGSNFDHPVQDAVDVYLADGGSAVELLELLAEVATYAAPQTRPDDGAEYEGEYAELAESLKDLAVDMNGRGARDAAVGELLTWARGRGLTETDVDEVVIDGLLAEATAVNNGGFEAQFRHLVEKWGPDVAHIKHMIVGGEQ